MALIRCTKKLLAELPPIREEVALRPTILGDWHANLVRIQRRKCVLFTHDEMLFSVFVPMLTKPHFQNLASVFLDHLIRTLESEAFRCDIIDQVKDDYTDNLTYSNTNNRSVMGSMNDIVNCLHFIIEKHGGIESAEPLEINRAINRMPLVKKPFTYTIRGLEQKFSRPSITFKIINHDTPEYKAAVALREEILYKPLGLTFSPEEFEAEKDQIHIAGFQRNEVVATAVLVPKGDACKMQRVAVKANRQGSGIGSQMISFCEEHAKARGFQSIYCHAQNAAVPFYLKNHYVAEGDYFEEATIPHVKMRKYLLWEMMESTGEEKSAILDKLVNFNRQVLGISGDKPSCASLNYVLKLDGKIIGGINSSLYLAQSILHVDHLFVDENHRSQQLGSALLKKVENQAKTMGAELAHLDTFDWQAKDFYLKHGYEIFGVLEDCPKSHKRYFLKKSL